MFSGLKLSAKQKQLHYSIQRTVIVGLLCIGFQVGGCKRSSDEERGEKPPPIASSQPGVCTGGGGQVEDKLAKSIVPRTVGKYCVDPNGETRSYGKEAEGTLDHVCTELFDGECEVYKSYGLDRVVTLRYVDGTGSPASVALNLSRFATNEGAFGFYTKRVVADSDPLVSAPAVLDAGAAAALGTGIAYVYGGPYVAELSYNNELETPDQLRRSSKRILPEIAQAIGKRVPGGKALPKSAARLPEEGRVPHGIVFEADDLLKISGVGPGAMGFYRDGKVRYRLLSLVREDEDSAKDILKTLLKLEGASAIKKLGFDAVRFSTQSQDEGPKLSWVVGRRGSTLVGVGDEEYVDRRSGHLLSDQDKLKKLRDILVGAKPPQ